MKKKKTNKFFKIIKYEVYPFDILLTCGTTGDEIIQYLEKNFGHKVSAEDKPLFVIPGNGRTIVLEGGQTVLWLKDFSPTYSFDLAILAHECFHAIDFLLRRIGVKLSADSDEVYAYTLQYIFRTAFEDLRHGYRPKTP